MILLNGLRSAAPFYVVWRFQFRGDVSDGLGDVMKQFSHGVHAWSSAFWWFYSDRQGGTPNGNFKSLPHLYIASLNTAK